MAKWSSGWKWSDGTKWADGLGAPGLFTSFIDRLGYHVSTRITQTAPAGATTAPTILTISLEVGPRAQLPHGFEAFIDRNEQTQRIAPRIHQTQTGTLELATEAGDSLITEGGDTIVLTTIYPFVIDLLSLLSNQRSRQQPTGV